MKNFFIRLLNTILPLPCPGCGSVYSPGFNRFCPECLNALPFISDEKPLCPGCGGVLDSALAVCTLCLNETERPWIKAYSIMEYRDSAKTLIGKLKYGNSPEIARPLGDLAAEKIINSQIRADMLIPIPLHFSRELARGYNQTDLIAQIAGKKSGLPVVNALKRIHKRSNQAKRNRADRHRQLAGIFALRNNVSLQGKHILLLDDVITTGATLHAAAKVLLKTHPASLSVITIARTPGKL